MKKIIWIIAVIPLIVTVILLPFIPERIPMHYNFNGEIDRWGSRAEQLIFPAAIILITLLWHFMIKSFEKKKAAARSEKEAAEAEANCRLLNIVSISMSVMYGIMHFFLLYGACAAADSGSDYAVVDIGRISCVLCGSILIILGNFMPRLRRNSVAGVRTVWSLYNDNTWRKSNRFGSIALIITGILIIITASFAGAVISTIMMIIYLILALVITMIYSKKVYDREKMSDN